MKIKLVKGLSCSIGSIKATKKNPVVSDVSEEDAKRAIATGYFEAVKEDEADAAAPSDYNDGASAKALDDMNVKELDAYAAAKGYDLSDITTKKDKLVRIKELDAAVPGSSDDGAGKSLLDGIM